LKNWGEEEEKEGEEEGEEEEGEEKEWREMRLETTMEERISNQKL
jgi:hypothetical protein